MWGRLIGLLFLRLQEQKFCQRYDQLMEAWEKKVERIENNPRRRAKESKVREYYEKQFPEIRKQRELQERMQRWDHSPDCWTEVQLFTALFLKNHDYGSTHTSPVSQKPHIRTPLPFGFSEDDTSFPFTQHLECSSAVSFLRPVVWIRWFIFD